MDKVDMGQPCEKEYIPGGIDKSIQTASAETPKYKLIYGKMCAILNSVDAIGKERAHIQNGQTKFKFRGIDDIYNELHKSFATHGVFCTTNVLERHQVERKSSTGGVLFYTYCKIEFVFWAEDGSSVSSVVWGEAMDSGDKGTNKAMAIAHKYALMQAFLIPTEDDKDPDAHAHNVAPQQTPQQASKQQAAANAQPAPGAQPAAQEPAKPTLKKSDKFDMHNLTHKKYFQKVAQDKMYNGTPEQMKKIAEDMHGRATIGDIPGAFPDPVHSEEVQM